MTDFGSELLLAGSPTQWVILAVVIVMLVAPRSLPALARFLAFHLANFLGGRLGLRPFEDTRATPKSAQTRPRKPLEQKVLPPSARAPGLRAGCTESLAFTKPRPRRSPVWVVTAVVSLAAAMLSWLLFRPR